MTDRVAPNAFRILTEFRLQLHRLLAADQKFAREHGKLTADETLVLLTIKSPCEEKVTVSRLVTWLEMDRTVVMETVDALVRRGLVARTRDRSDRRCFQLTTTPAGDLWVTPLVDEALLRLAKEGPQLLLGLRQAIAHAMAHATRAAIPVRADVAEFALQRKAPRAV